MVPNGGVDFSAHSVLMFGLARPASISYVTLVTPARAFLISAAHWNYALGSKRTERKVTEMLRRCAVFCSSCTCASSVTLSLQVRMYRFVAATCFFILTQIKAESLCHGEVATKLVNLPFKKNPSRFGCKKPRTVPIVFVGGFICDAKWLFNKIAIQSLFLTGKKEIANAREDLLETHIRKLCFERSEFLTKDSDSHSGSL